MSRPFLACVGPACLLPGLLLTAVSPALAGDALRPRRAPAPAEDARPAAADALLSRLVLRIPAEPVDLPTVMTDDAPSDAPRPWRCGTVVARGRPTPLGIPGYAVYPLTSGGGGIATRYGYCVFPAVAPVTGPR